MTELETVQVEIHEEKEQIEHLNGWVKKLEKMKAADKSAQSNLILYKELIEERRRCPSLLRQIENSLCKKS